MLRTRAPFKTTKSTKTILTDHQGTPLETAILNEEVDEIFRTFRTGAQFLITNHQDFLNAPHGSVILRGVGEDKSTKFFEMLRTGVRFLKIGIKKNYLKKKVSRTGAQFFSMQNLNFSGCPARERNF